MRTNNYFGDLIIGFVKHVLPIFLAVFLLLAAIVVPIWGLDFHPIWIAGVYPLLCLILYFVLPIRIRVAQNTYHGLENFFSAKVDVKWPGWHFKGVFQITPKDRETFIQDTKKSYEIELNENWPTKTGPVTGTVRVFYACDVKNDENGTRNEKAKKRFKTTAKEIDKLILARMARTIDTKLKAMTSEEAKVNKNSILTFKDFTKTNDYPEDTDITRDYGIEIFQIDFIDLNDPPEIAKANEQKKVFEIWAENINSAVKKLIKTNENPNGLFKENEEHLAREWVRAEMVKNYQQFDITNTSGTNTPVVISPKQK